MKKLNFKKNLLIIIFSWLSVISITINAITINVFSYVKQEACVAIAGDETEKKHALDFATTKSKSGSRKRRKSKLQRRKEHVMYVNGGRVMAAMNIYKSYLNMEKTL
jgi:hypothetical protein